MARDVVIEFDDIDILRPPQMIVDKARLMLSIIIGTSEQIWCNHRVSVQHNTSPPHFVRIGAHPVACISAITPEVQPM